MCDLSGGELCLKPLVLQKESLKRENEHFVVM